jgi:hypothetical protein
MSDLKAIIEALMFASPDPVTVKALAKLLESEASGAAKAEIKEEIVAAIEALKRDYDRPGGLHWCGRKRHLAVVLPGVISDHCGGMRQPIQSRIWTGPKRSRRCAILRCVRAAAAIGHVNVQTEHDGAARQVAIRLADDSGRPIRAMAIAPVSGLFYHDVKAPLGATSNTASTKLRSGLVGRCSRVRSNASGIARSSASCKAFSPRRATISPRTTTFPAW